MKYRSVSFMGSTQGDIDSWPEGVGEMIKTNLQALQGAKANSFSNLPDWINSGKVTDKKLKGKKLEGSSQLTVKHRNSYRVVYIAEIEDRIFILHAFKKQTEGVDKQAMKTVTGRLKRVRHDYG